jgi:Ca2+-transporting ATPase
MAPVHTAVPGRVRLKIPTLRRDETLKCRLETGLGGNGIRSVSASTCTGTVLIIHDPRVSLSEIERRVRDAAAADASTGRSVTSVAPPWHSFDADRVVAALDSRSVGLTSAAASVLLRQQGANILVKLERRSRAEMLLDQFRTLPVALLAGTAILSLATGGVLDAAIVLSVLVGNSLIGFFSESWTEQTIESLERADLAAVRVLRDGKERIEPGENLVPGDVILLRGSDIVPADARILVADRLTVNEGALTGESLPVAKAANVLSASAAPLADRRNMLYRGTIVTEGSGRAVVVATGDRTEMARIQTLLGAIVRPATPLQSELDQIGRRLFGGALLASGLTFAIGLLRGQPWLTMLRITVSLGVAAVPEGLPTMVTTTLAMGVRRLRRDDLLVRRLDAIESLGAVQLVCFDKTGTLTLNRMTVTRVCWNDHEASLVEDQYRAPDEEAISCSTDPDLALLIKVCVLCNDASVAPESRPGATGGSSTEIALLDAAARFGTDLSGLRQSYPRLSTVERAAGRRYMATVHTAPGPKRLIAVKGDPLAVLELCRYRSTAGNVRKLGPKDRSLIEAKNLAMAEAGLRVLGIAIRHLSAEPGLRTPVADLTWLGMVGMADPLRRGAVDLVQALQRAGVGLVMLTGDQRATAVAIAAELGLSPDGKAEVIEGDRLENPTSTVERPRIYARLTPAQKLEVIGDLQRAGLRVAMLGDGVNDTPALKVADVSVTLASSATDAARDIADMVLLGDDLSPMIRAFETSRSVRDNIRRALRFLIATNVSETMLMLFAITTGLARPLSPGQLLWINLLSDVLPAMGLALERPDSMLMSEALPASPAILSGADIPQLVRDGGLIAGSAAAAQATADLVRGASGSAVSFTSLVTGQLLYALACRPAGRPVSGYLSGALIASFAAQAAALYLPSLRGLVGHSMAPADLCLSAVGGLLPLASITALNAYRSSDDGQLHASEPSAPKA